ncbi:MAG: hypothetical protein OEN56_10025 [Gemmatimonadota bacterium]|nr:hypothetical protein [Gemmatimonadota bacterium]
MPESRIVPARRLKTLVVYFAVAFLVVVVLGTALPSGSLRSGLVVAWMVLFPLGGWLVYRRTE